MKKTQKRMRKLTGLSRVLAFMFVASMLISAAACGTTPAATATSTTTQAAATTQEATTAAQADSEVQSFKIGISMPTQSLQRWNQDGDNMRKAFEAAGYSVDLQYGGDNEVPVQISQIENMIASGVNVLVIAAIEGDSMTEVLATAKSKGIPVIAYDRLIMGTDAVTYYATFDNWRVGTMQGEYVRDQLKLDSESGPFNIEFFTGDPGDNNINFFFDGAMSILQPYLDSGVLVTPSGQTEKSVVATLGWSTENAQTRMENLISTNGYRPSGGTPLHAVMCSNDSTAQGVTNALVNADFTKENFPVVTGQDCDIVSVKNMLAGVQSMSVFKDTRTLANAVVDMVNAIVAGNEPPINDRETYDNGTGIIPTFLCEPVAGSAENYKELLIDSGYYTEDQLQ